jgi:hypothetical protein
MQYSARILTAAVLVNLHVLTHSLQPRQFSGPYGRRILISPRDDVIVKEGDYSPGQQQSYLHASENEMYRVSQLLRTSIEHIPHGDHDEFQSVTEELEHEALILEIQGRSGAVHSPGQIAENSSIQQQKGKLANVQSNGRLGSSSRMLHASDMMSHASQASHASHASHARSLMGLNSFYWYCDTYDGPVCPTCQQIPYGSDPCNVSTTNLIHMKALFRDVTTPL